MAVSLEKVEKANKVSTQMNKFRSNIVKINSNKTCVYFVWFLCFIRIKLF